MIRKLLTSLFILLLAANIAASDVSLEGEDITFIIPNPPGGGNDFIARTLAPILEEVLPGNPNVRVINLPGASGVIAANRFVQLGEAGEIALMIGAPLQIDPLNYRREQANYNPVDFHFLGGFELGGAVMLINNDAIERLTDHDQEPVVMGSLAGRPRTSMITAGWAAEAMDWNMRWVTGYDGGDSLILALERGEIDMTALSSIFLVEQLTASGKFSILVQTGTLQDGKVVRRPGLEGGDIITEVVAGRLPTKVQQEAFNYWLNMRNLEKWVAAAPGTDPAIVEVLRQGYDAALRSDRFQEASPNISDSLNLIHHEDFAAGVATLNATPESSINYVFEMLRGQGLSVAN